jgi:hypothetical protein
MRILWRALGAAIAAAVLLGVAWGSRAPLLVASSEQALVRISFGARPERIEQCVTQTDEELAKVAPQMRQRLVCEGVAARYRLQLFHDGRLVLSQVVRGGGLRHDRQLYVFREVAVPARPAALSMRLTRIDTVAATEEDADEGDDEDDEDDQLLGGRAGREREERRRRRAESIPPELRLDLRATLAPREVLLLTYDPDRRQLTAVPAGRGVVPRR